jgi:hypothetical protein
MRTSRWSRGLLVLLLVVAAGCVRAPRWRGNDKPQMTDIEATLTATSYADLERALAAGEIPDVPMRARLRPCCAFGADLGAKVGPVPVPGYRIGNILGPEDVGPHTFDSGVLRVRRAEQEAVLLNNERNGLVYTCRGGFIDTAHVRDYADWGIFLGTESARSLEGGTSIDLPPEGGNRRIVTKPIPDELIDRFGRERIGAAMSETITFQLSIWHEVATWFGWASVPGFSERASAFSPEDLYSNLLGIKLCRALARRRSGRDENLYNASTTRWMAQGIEFLQPVPEEVARDAMRAVDGVWWDSSTRLPDPRLVLRRSFEYQDPVMPWLVPDSLAPDSLLEHCGSSARPLPLVYATEAQGLQIDDFVTLEIEVDDNLAAQEPFLSMGRRVTHRDFPAIIDVVKAQNIAEFGPNADRPE